MTLTPVNTDLPIGLALKLERTAARVSLTTVALGLGVSIGHLSHIEAGRRTASPELIDRYRAVLKERVA